MCTSRTACNPSRLWHQIVAQSLHLYSLLPRGWLSCAWHKASAMLSSLVHSELLPARCRQRAFTDRRTVVCRCDARSSADTIKSSGDQQQPIARRSVLLCSAAAATLLSSSAASAIGCVMCFRMLESGKAAVISQKIHVKMLKHAGAQVQEGAQKARSQVG